MKRPIVLTALVLLVGACSGSAASSAGSSPGVPSASPTAVSLAAPTSIGLLPGEPWLLHDRWNGDGKKGLFLVRPDGTDDHLILSSLTDVRAGDWSSDGTRIAFVYRGAGSAADGEIWMAAASGAGAAKLLDGGPDCSGAFYPAWSPGDRKLAFVCYTSDGNGNLAVYDPASKVVTHLVSLVWPEVFDNPPRWSPDGSTIAFDILHWDPTNTFLDGSLIATIPATGGKERRLMPFASFAAYPDWRPDGKALVFNTYDQGNMASATQASNIYEIRPDGSARRQVTTASTDGSYRITQPRWDPSGLRIWVTIWQPRRGISIGWVDPTNGAVADLAIEGSRAVPRPLR